MHENRGILYEQIKTANPFIPGYLSKELQDLLHKLLDKNPEKRLGSLNDFEDIKNHPWFKSIDWTMMINKKCEPPTIPYVKSELDTRNFDKVFFRFARQ